MKYEIENVYLKEDNVKYVLFYMLGIRQRLIFYQVNNLIDF